MDINVWLYRLQQRIGITRREAAVILVLVGLFSLGLVVRAMQNNPRPLPKQAYTEADSLFQQRASGRLPAGNVATPAADSIDQVPASPASSTPLQVNLNTAGSQKLQRLRGIGPAMAQRILAYRKRRGGFRRVEELRRVRGIGPKTLADLEAHVFVEAAK